MLKNLTYLIGSGKRGKKPSKKKLNDVKIVCGNEDKIEEINLTKDKDKYINCETIYIKNIKNQFADFFKTNNLINLFFDVDVGKEIKINPENIPNLKTLNISDNKINFDNINKNTIKIYEESNILDYLNLYKKGKLKNYNKTSPSIIFKNLEELKIKNCKIKKLLPITPKLKKLELILNYKNIHKTTIPYRLDLIKEIEDIHINGYTTKLLFSMYLELENCKKIVLKNTLIDILPSVKNLNILEIDSINVFANTGTLPYDFFKNNKELSKVKEIYFNNIYFDKRFSNIDLNWNSNSINYNFLYKNFENYDNNKKKIENNFSPFTNIKNEISDDSLLQFNYLFRRQIYLSDNIEDGIVDLIIKEFDKKNPIKNFIFICENNNPNENFKNIIINKLKEKIQISNEEATDIVKNCYIFNTKFNDIFYNNIKKQDYRKELYYLFSYYSKNYFSNIKLPNCEIFHANNTNLFDFSNLENCNKIVIKNLFEVDDMIFNVELNCKYFEAKNFTYKYYVEKDPEIFTSSDNYIKCEPTHFHIDFPNKMKLLKLSNIDFYSGLNIDFKNLVIDDFILSDDKKYFLSLDDHDQWGYDDLKEITANVYIFNKKKFKLNFSNKSIYDLIVKLDSIEEVNIDEQDFYINFKEENYYCFKFVKEDWKNLFKYAYNLGQNDFIDRNQINILIMDMKEKKLGIKKKYDKISNLTVNNKFILKNRYFNNFNFNENNINLEKVNHLDIHRCHITSLPLLKNVKKLSFPYNDISELKLPNIDKLTFLDCKYNNIKNIPDLVNCEYLYCNNNKINKIGSLEKCKNLDINYNYITELPKINYKIIKYIEYTKCKFLDNKESIDFYLNINNLQNYNVSLQSAQLDEPDYKKFNNFFGKFNPSYVDGNIDNYIIRQNLREGVKFTKRRCDQLKGIDYNEIYNSLEFYLKKIDSKVYLERMGKGSYADAAYGPGIQRSFINFLIEKINSYLNDNILNFNMDCENIGMILGNCMINYLDPNKANQKIENMFFQIKFNFYLFAALLGDFKIPMRNISYYNSIYENFGGTKENEFGNNIKYYFYYYLDNPINNVLQQIYLFEKIQAYDPFNKNSTCKYVNIKKEIENKVYFNEKFLDKSFIKLTEDIEIMLIKYYQKYLNDNEEIIRKHFLNIIDSKDFFNVLKFRKFKKFKYLKNKISESYEKIKLDDNLSQKLKNYEDNINLTKNILEINKLINDRSQLNDDLNKLKDMLKIKLKKDIYNKKNYDKKILPIEKEFELSVDNILNEKSGHILSWLEKLLFQKDYNLTFRNFIFKSTMQQINKKIIENNLEDIIKKIKKDSTNNKYFHIGGNNSDSNIDLLNNHINFNIKFNEFFDLILNHGFSSKNNEDFIDEEIVINNEKFNLYYDKWFIYPSSENIDINTEKFNKKILDDKIKENIINGYKKFGNIENFNNLSYIDIYEFVKYYYSCYIVYDMELPFDKNFFNRLNYFIEDESNVESDSDTEENSNNNSLFSPPFDINKYKLLCNNLKFSYDSLLNEGIIKYKIVSHKLFKRLKETKRMFLQNYMEIHKPYLDVSDGKLNKTKFKLLLKNLNKIININHEFLGKLDKGLDNRMKINGITERFYNYKENGIYINHNKIEPRYKRIIRRDINFKKNYWFRYYGLPYAVIYLRKSLDRFKNRFNIENIRDYKYVNNIQWKYKFSNQFYILIDIKGYMTLNDKKIKSYYDDLEEELKYLPNVLDDIVNKLNNEYFNDYENNLKLNKIKTDFIKYLTKITEGQTDNIYFIGDHEYLYKHFFNKEVYLKDFQKYMFLQPINIILRRDYIDRYKNMFSHFILYFIKYIDNLEKTNGDDINKKMYLQEKKKSIILALSGSKNYILQDNAFKIIAKDSDSKDFIKDIIEGNESGTSEKYRPFFSSIKFLNQGLLYNKFVDKKIDDKFASYVGTLVKKIATCFGNYYTYVIKTDWDANDLETYPRKFKAFHDLYASKIFEEIENNDWVEKFIFNFEYEFSYKLGDSVYKTENKVKIKDILVDKNVTFYKYDFVNEKIDKNSPADKKQIYISVITDVVNLSNLLMIIKSFDQIIPILSYSE